MLKNIDLINIFNTNITRITNYTVFPTNHTLMLLDEIKIDDL